MRKLIVFQIGLIDTNFIILVIQYHADVLKVIIFILNYIIDLAEPSRCFALAPVQLDAWFDVIGILFLF